ncbi:hypothetical protein I3843_05G144100 [Carya illinoinensis]|nr:hypothetical protein I3843_05G144100 [Carya illinoinensis]
MHKLGNSVDLLFSNLLSGINMPFLFLESYNVNLLLQNFGSKDSTSKEVIAFGGNFIFWISRHSSFLLFVCGRVWFSAKPHQLTYCQCQHFVISVAIPKL